MRKPLIALALVLMVLPAAAWSMSSTLNTDFEAGFQTSGADAGAATGWYAFDLGGTAARSGDSAAFHGGAWSQKVDGTGVEGGVKAKFDVVDGHTYAVSVWVKVAGGGGGYLAVRGDGQEDAAVVNSQGSFDVSTGDTGGAWVQLSKTVTAAGTAITVFFDAWECVTNWDDVTLVDVTPPSATPPYLIWVETVRYQQGGMPWYSATAGNPIGHGQVLIDGTKSIIAEGQGGVLLYDDHQTNGTAFVKGTASFSYFFDPGDPGWPATSNYSTKAATMLNGRLYSSTMKCQIHQSTLPTWDGVITPNDGPWGPGMSTGRVESDCTGLVTDGTYLYGSDNPGAMAVGPSYIYKWSVDPAANGGNGALTEVWKVQIPTTTWLISIGYYGGKLYAAEGFRGRNIYEIDCATGAYATILSGDNLIPEACGTDAWYMGQIARCGDRLVLANWTGNLTQWQLVSGTWTLKSSHTGIALPGYPPYLLGLSLKPGPDGNAKYAWISGSNLVYFVDLTPTFPSVTLGEARKMDPGYPMTLDQDLVVTKVGTNEFWAQDENRSAGVHVLLNGAQPAANTKVHVNVVGGAPGSSASGEKELTLSAVPTYVSDLTPEPLFVTNKSLGPGPDGAGLANDGLLVKVHGTFKVYDNANAVYIDDGSAVANDLTTGEKGLKVYIADPASVVNFNDYINWGGVPCTFTVTGIVRLEKLADGTIIRRIDARSEADVVITAL